MQLLLPSERIVVVDDLSICVFRRRILFRLDKEVAGAGVLGPGSVSLASQMRKAIALSGVFLFLWTTGFGVESVGAQCNCILCLRKRFVRG